MALSLTPTPPANAFVRPSEASHEQERYPLDLHLCRVCGHAQLLDVVDPGLLFTDYVYVSGTSAAFVEHFRTYAADLLDRTQPAAGSLVVEIGSNDGTLLKWFQSAGMRVLGVDPARDIARNATQRGIPTLPQFFTATLADMILAQHGPAAIIAANNVFAHVDDLAEIVRGVCRLLAPNGLFVFEVSYLADVVTKTLFDTIYHEHLSYHALRPLCAFLERHGLQIIDATRVDTHGGSLRVTASPRKTATEGYGDRVNQLLALESILKLDDIATYRTLADTIETRKQELRQIVTAMLDQGSRLIGFGAPAKATTLLYHFDIGPTTLDFIVDDSPLKQGLLTPGMHIPVVASEHIATNPPDGVVILAWNFAQQLVPRCRSLVGEAAKIIVPLPTVRVL